MEERPSRNVLQTLLTLMLIVLTALTSFTIGFGSAAVVGRYPGLFRATPAAPASTTTPPAIPSPAQTEDETFQLFWEVWDIVKEQFYGDTPDMPTVTYGAIQGMLETLGDPYTSFMEPSVAEVIREDATGSFEGIGAYVTLREDGKVEIASVFPDQPAEGAGLRSGDRILAVDGESIVGLGLYEAIAHIRGPAGSEAMLLIERVDEETGEVTTFEVTLTRARIEIPLVESRMLDGNVGYVRLTEFSATAASRMEQALNELLAQEPVGIVFDLRSNPGGWLDQAVDVADLFLGDGVVLIERFSGNNQNVYNSYDGEIAETIPLVVLVDGGSASASEIVAGAIQDRGRGVLIGTQTFGKGSVQRPYALSDGSELRVTIAHWFTPNDVEIHGQGLTPDIEVPLPEDLEPGQDPQLDRAVQYLLGESPTPQPTATATPSE